MKGRQVRGIRLLKVSCRSLKKCLKRWIDFRIIVTCSLVNNIRIYEKWIHLWNKHYSKAGVKESILSLNQSNDIYNVVKLMILRTFDLHYIHSWKPLSLKAPLVNPLSRQTRINFIPVLLIDMPLLMLSVLAIEMQYKLHLWLRFAWGKTALIFLSRASFYTVLTSHDFYCCS